MIKDRKIVAAILALIVVALILGAFTVKLAYDLFVPGGGNNPPLVGNAVAGNALKMPALLEDQNPDPNIADFELTAQAGSSEFYPGLGTETLGYNGSYLGPVLRVRRGEKVNIRVANQLAFPTTVHWHGLVVDGEQDGGPHQVIQPGGVWQPGFTVDQPAATLWYHPHYTGNTAQQVYYGLAGLIYIDDPISQGLPLPKEYGVNDIPLIVQDRNFNSDGSLAYQTSMMGVVPGETILINGTVDPTCTVSAGLVRLRILNGSNSQNFNFSLSDGSRFQQIASDGGFLEKPLTRDKLFLAPGERAEIIVDFSRHRGSALSLMADQRSVLDFRISDQTPVEAAIPEILTEIPPIPMADNPVTRVFELQIMGINGTINGKSFDMNRINEEVRLNETEIWLIRNLGGMMMQDGGHPFHVHGTQFQIISRDGLAPPPEERGFKDTVFVDTGEEVMIKVRFTHPGIFMYHCHILEHEDGGMMGQFRVR